VSAVFSVQEPVINGKSSFIIVKKQQFVDENIDENFNAEQLT